MEYIIYLIGLLILIRYFYILIKYIKIKEFKKKKFEGNILGLIACTMLTIFIINILILMILVNHNIENDINMWFIFLSGIFSIFLYPCYWVLCLREKNRIKSVNYYNEIDNKIKNKYGDNNIYNIINCFVIDIPDDSIVNDYFNELSSILTNGKISFFHPKEYESILDAYRYLYLNDYIKLLDGNDSLYLTCNNVNVLLKKLDIKININADSIIKDDDQYIELRRKDMIPTLFYDLNKINEIIKKRTKKYELVITRIFNPSINRYDLFMCIANSSLLKKFFASDENQVRGENNEK